MSDTSEDYDDQFTTPRSGFSPARNELGSSHHDVRTTTMDLIITKLNDIASQQERLSSDLRAFTTSHWKQADGSPTMPEDLADFELQPRPPSTSSSLSTSGSESDVALDSDSDTDSNKTSMPHRPAPDHTDADLEITRLESKLRAAESLLQAQQTINSHAQLKATRLEESVAWLKTQLRERDDQLRRIRGEREALATRLEDLTTPAATEPLGRSGGSTLRVINDGDNNAGTGADERQSAEDRVHDWLGARRASSSSSSSSSSSASSYTLAAGATRRLTAHNSWAAHRGLRAARSQPILRSGMDRTLALAPVFESHED